MSHRKLPPRGHSHQTPLAPRLHTAPGSGIVPRMRQHLLWIGLVALAACEPGPTTPAGEWTVPFKALDGALLSVWGTGSDDVWSVGADVGDGPTVLHYDGAAWTRHPTGATGTLWWVAGHGDGVWMSGEAGLVLRYDIPSNTFEPHPTPTPERLYGIIPFSDTDVWTVGAADNGLGGVVYRWDGSDWSVPDGLTAELTADLGFFKIWGPSADDLWIVGDGGAALHRSGGAWERLEVAGGGTKLFTVHGRGDVVIGVGGAFQGLIVELAPGTVTDVTPPISEAEVMQLNGVYVGAKATIAVGAQGTVWQRDDAGKWSQDADAPETPRDYHSVYVDPDGGLWAVGGTLLSDPPTDGVLAHFGQPLKSTSIEE